MRLSKSIHTMQTDSEVSSDSEMNQPRQTTVAEVWPGEFELEIETGAAGVATTTVHSLETPQLQLLYEQIEEGEVKELPVVLKADVQGSVEVLKDTLEKLGTDKVKPNVIHAQVGAVSTNDVILATASNAIIVGFNVRPEKNASEMAAKEGIDIRLHTVIYELTDELKKAMAGLLDPTFKEVVEGHAEVRETFKVPKAGTIAGSHVIDGKVSRNSLARLLRDNVVVHDGKIGSLRRFKDDASEVRAGFDCGIGLERYQDFKPGDIIESYYKDGVAPEL